MLRIPFCLILLIIPCGNSLDAQEGQGDHLRASVTSVALRLVRIDTIGGHEKVGDEFANEGSGTGFLLDRDGYVVTAAFLFLHDPASILLRFPDGTKKIARKIATDKNRMLTLLKVENLDAGFLPEGDLTESVRPKSTLVVAEPCLAVGAALSPDEPNVTRGVISGVDRIWGKAIQTDAAVGPNNYGGPLIDRNGKLIGLLAPLSMMSGDVAAGAETYDAGVGMAIPFDDILALLSRLKEGKDLEPGFVGLVFKENRTFIGEPVIDTVAPDSSAGGAGLKVGDKILGINDSETDSALRVTMVLKSCYAGDRLAIRYQRDGKEHTVDVVAEEPPKPKK